MTADGVAEATAPMLVAYMRDRQGTYDSGFIVLIAAAILGAVAVALLPRQKAEPHSATAATPFVSPTR